MKLEIFDIPNLKTCFITGKESKKLIKGDYLFEICKFRNILGAYGIDSQWNTIPVTSDINVNYKIFKFNKKQKNRFV